MAIIRQLTDIIMGQGMEYITNGGIIINVIHIMKFQYLNLLL